VERLVICCRTRTIWLADTTIADRWWDTKREKMLKRASEKSMDLLDRQSCYRALQTHDRRFDGRFYVGVTSTRIYCRPICTVKTPKLENCRFFPAAAVAESQGFRPCLRCRPELAPGNSVLDVSERQARRAAVMIDEGYLVEHDIPDLADRLNMTDRHLRRIFKQEYGISVIDYAQTQRLLIAKRLLADTTLPIVEVAISSGFASLRRFNALFQQRYRLKPTDLRKSGRIKRDEDSFHFELGYRPPYDWPAMTAFLSARTIPGVEHVAENRYLRTVSIRTKDDVRTGWIEVANNERRSSLRIKVAPSLARSIPVVLTRLKRQFDLSCDPIPITEVLGSSLPVICGLRVPGAFDGFETAVRAVLGQQVSVKAARTLAGRIAARFGETLDTPWLQLTHTFPNAARIAQATVDQICSVGLTRGRAATIIGLAQAISTGQIRLDHTFDVAATMAAMKTVPGIGEWTAQYVAMRVLAWPDAFPHTDLGIKKALGESNPRQVLMRSEQWKPWRAYAAINLWHSLNDVTGG